MSNRDKMFTTPLIAQGITKTNEGVSLGLLNWMIHNRLTTNAPNIAYDCRIGKAVVRPYWLNIMVGSKRTHCCDFVRMLMS